MNDNKHGESEKAYKHKKLKSKRRSVLEIGLKFESRVKLSNTYEGRDGECCMHRSIIIFREIIKISAENGEFDLLAKNFVKRHFILVYYALNSRKFTLTHFWQKFRERNVFNKEWI